MYEQITNLAVATTLTVPAGVHGATIMAEAQNVRYTLDNETTPSATVGMILYAGTSQKFDAGQLAVLQLIQAAPGAIVNIEFF